MTKKYHILLLLTFILVVSSCSKDADVSDLLPADTEVVNGFRVEWRAYMTEDQRQVIKEILNDMVLVEGGTFLMGTSKEYDGDARENEFPAHWVQLSDYYIGAHELTYDQITKLLPSTRSSALREFNGKYLNYYWEDWKYVLEFISECTGVIFEFPSEAQWEYAARGGKMTKGFLYPGSNKWEEIYYDDLNDPEISAPNELGIYDMADKRGEWCLDSYAKYTDGMLAVDPFTSVGEGHVVRGGCHVSVGISKYWESTSPNYVYDYSHVYDDMRMCRSTARAFEKGKSWDIGCRPVINIVKL